eukprot:GHUV01026404.1.p1 GENE.GHUV01026404.1~~GHUV01026404.1.p1  ORF type:complete len:347 (+),score=113.06 GHUV01026404.1:518-1558(+)
MPAFCVSKAVYRDILSRHALPLLFLQPSGHECHTLLLLFPCAALISLSSVKVLDTSWYLPPMGRDARAEFRTCRIPCAQFWDIDGVCDPNTDLPHMLPSEEAFAAAADALSIGNDDAVVVYDGMGMFAAPRAWWTWKVFGHDRIAVLEGGLPAWKAVGADLDTSAVNEQQLNTATVAARAAAFSGSTKYKAILKREKVIPLQDMLKLVEPAAAAVAAGSPEPDVARQVVDARPAGRFRGVEPEPRPGLRLGHMPGAKNVPFMMVYEKSEMAGARLKPVDELEKVFEAAAVDVQQPIICSCGSGLTACVVALAAFEVSGQLAAVYDGSWSEWGAVDGAPIVSEPQDQ